MSAAAKEMPDEMNKGRPLPEDAMIILPLRNIVLFPGMIVPLTIGRERSLAAAQEAARLQRPLGILLQHKDTSELPGPEDLHWVGTTANVLRYITGPDGTHHAICQGLQRFRALQFLDGYPFLAARVQLIDPVTTVDTDIEARALNLRQKATEILSLLPQVPDGVQSALNAIEEPENLADFVASQIDVETADKQKLLETFDLKQRLDQLLELLGHRLEVLRISHEIDQRTRESINDKNRKHVLREQMQTIQKELGEDESGGSEIAELEQAIVGSPGTELEFAL